MEIKLFLWSFFGLVSSFIAGMVFAILRSNSREAIIEELKDDREFSKYFSDSDISGFKPDPKTSKTIKLRKPDNEDGVYENKNVFITLDFQKMLDDRPNKNEPPQFKGKYPGEPFKLTSWDPALKKKGAKKINEIELFKWEFYLEGALEKGEARIYSKTEGKYVDRIIKSKISSDVFVGYGYYLPDSENFFTVCHLHMYPAWAAQSQKISKTKDWFKSFLP